ncbi:CheR family methyltransferase [Chitinimonas viridis]|uniref:Chemotaxis protein methyltransferase n=1 Tax=Chitinimonas viridis TaxID=664880 RepID=A0ABT8B3S5_9NEIS|nr:CheR family methyltransferase [Chitinimonas viridis]MDN3576134.1 CheR family methyltransferase [Chitinimonas viridis]
MSRQDSMAQGGAAMAGNPPGSPRVLNAARDFAYTGTDFQLAREMIRERAGVALAECKQHMVYNRLSKRVRALGLPSITSYLTLLRKDATHPEWEDFTSALTTHLTAFYREPHHFEMLSELLHARGREPSRIWCAAASTGEEPYTIAMTVAEAYGRFDTPVEIVASDIDIRALAHAEQGIYSLERVTKMPLERIRQFFQRGTGKRHGYARVCPELKRMVSFMPCNLLEARWPIAGHFDFIFCRNVLIYFKREDQYTLTARLVSQLKPQGVLFLGHSENPQGSGLILETVGKTAYRAKGPRP